MTNPSLRKRVIDLQVGDSITIPVDSVSDTTIRSYASDLGFLMQRKYSTRRDREARTYTITRQA